MLIHTVVPDKGEITLKVPGDWVRQDMEIEIRKASGKHTGKLSRFYGVLNLPNIDQEIRSIRDEWKERQ